MTSNDLNKGQYVYYTRIFPELDIFELFDIRLRTIEDDFFCGTEEHTKQAFIFSYDDIGKTIFLTRSEALEFINYEESKYRDYGED